MGIKSYIENHKYIEKIITAAKTISLPGFQRVSIFDISTFFIRETYRDSINVRASSIAFNLFLALFPLIIFLFTLIPYVPIENFQGQLMDFLHSILPDYTFKTIESTINDLISIPRSGLASVGFILALFFASNGISSMIESFEKNNIAFKEQSYFVKRGKAIGLTVLLTIVFIFTIILVIGSQYLLTYVSEYVKSSTLLYYLVIGIRGFIFFFLIFNSIAVIYSLAPSLKEKWHYFSPGTIFTSILIFFSTYLFTFYIDTIDSYNKIYGSIGAIMAVMLLIYIIALWIIIGFELNNSITMNKSLKKQLPEKK